jgi:sec-independent protein translocase protein TatB
MIDFGFDKIALIGAVALIVIGPERLPKVARTIGHLMGKAQRYVAEVKSEVNRSIELEELKNMKTQFEDAARDVGQAVSSEVRQTSTEMNEAWGELSSPSGPGYRGADNWQEGSALPEPPVFYTHPGKNWRLKRGAMPQWYRARHGVRSKAQSGAARVARFRPPRAPASP